MLMKLLYKWPVPEMLEKNSWVQHTNKQACVHIAPTVLFMSQPQLEMHFDDNWFFYFFHTSLKMHDMHNTNFFQEIYGDRSDNTQWKCLKKSQVALIKY